MSQTAQLFINPPKWAAKSNIMNYKGLNIEDEHKYNASLHICANSPEVEFIGKVNANSIKELKENARNHARNWNKHLFGRIHVQDANKGIELYVNP